MSIVPATVEALETFRRDPDAFAELLHGPIPAGWPTFPEGIEFTIDKLRERPDEADWWLHFFFAGNRLVGSGGFVGPPDDGVVEIGYEIAPEYRGRGLAAAAARAMIAKAFVEREVHTIVAHTRPVENPSASVLRSTGFRRIGEFADENDGTVWRWELVDASAC